MGCVIVNAYCVLESRVTYIDTTVLGNGERNYITPLSGLIARLIVTDRKYIVSKYRIDKLSYIETLVASAVEEEIPFNPFHGSFSTEIRVKKELEQAF